MITDLNFENIQEIHFSKSDKKLKKKDNYGDIVKVIFGLVLIQFWSQLQKYMSEKIQKMILSFEKE